MVSSVDRSGAFLDRDVEQFQQCAKLSVGRAFVISQARPHNGLDQLRAFSGQFTLCNPTLSACSSPLTLGCQPFPPSHAESPSSAGPRNRAEFAALLIDPQRHDMEMLSGNVLVLENDIRLFAVTHAFHVLTSDFPELTVPILCCSPGQLIRSHRHATIPDGDAL